MSSVQQASPDHASSPASSSAASPSSLKRPAAMGENSRIPKKTRNSEPLGLRRDLNEQVVASILPSGAGTTAVSKTSGREIMTEKCLAMSFLPLRCLLQGANSREVSEQVGLTPHRISSLLFFMIRHRRRRLKEIAFLLIYYLFQGVKDIAASIRSTGWDSQSMFTVMFSSRSSQDQLLDISLSDSLKQWRLFFKNYNFTHVSSLFSSFRNACLQIYIQTTK